jgi:cytochrome oxidase Cu insertion factor (SCO1/SenC/PrrC family)
MSPRPEIRRSAAGPKALPIAGPIALALALALACGATAFAGAGSDARDIPLVDQTGARFTLRDLRRPTAVIFVAARCGDACPIAEALFARLSAAMARGHVDGRLLTVTLDPENDSPRAMANLAHAFRADATRWRWASGRPDDVRRLLDAFNVARLDGKFHGTFAYVLDAQGLPARLVMLSTDTESDLLGYFRAALRRG